MRFVALAIILLSFPIFVGLLKSYPAKRDLALSAVGFMLLLAGDLAVEAAIISWRLWPGVAKGMMISLVDTLCLALLITRSGGRLRVPLMGIAMLYLLPLLISMFVSTVPLAGLFVVTRYLLILIMIAAIVGEMRRPTAMLSLLKGIAAGVILQSGYVIYEKLTGVIQAKGTFPHQNILGMIVEIAAILILTAILNGAKGRILYLGLIAALIVVAGGGSRATMGFIALGLVLTLVLSLARSITPRKLKILGMSVVVAAVVVPMSFATLSTRFKGGSYVTEEDARATMETAAGAIAADYPMGIGANNYVNVANSEGYNKRAGVSWGGNNLTAPVHNSYLLAKAETGILGLIAFFVLMIAPILSGLKLGFSDRKSPLFGIGIGCAVVNVTIALHCMYEYAWHLEAVQRLFFVNFAILSGCIALRRAALSRRSAKKIQVSERQRGQPIDPSAGVDPVLNS